MCVKRLLVFICLLVLLVPASASARSKSTVYIYSLQPQTIDCNKKLIQGSLTGANKYAKRSLRKRKHGKTRNVLVRAKTILKNYRRQPVNLCDAAQAHQSAN